MQQLRRAMPILSLASLASLSACAPQPGPGLFCDVVQGPITFPAPVAAVVVQGARPEAVSLDAQNRYGESNCPGWGQSER